MTDQEKQQVCIGFAEWIAGNQYTEYQLTLVDGEYYYADDTDGDQPLSPNALYDLYLADLALKNKET